MSSSSDTVDSNESLTFTQKVDKEIKNISKSLVSEAGIVKDDIEKVTINVETETNNMITDIEKAAFKKATDILALHTVEILEKAKVNMVLSVFKTVDDEMRINKGTIEGVLFNQYFSSLCEQVTEDSITSVKKSLSSFQLEEDKLWNDTILSKLSKEDKASYIRLLIYKSRKQGMDSDKLSLDYDKNNIKIITPKPVEKESYCSFM
jgi:hypothetical protein